MRNFFPQKKDVKVFMGSQQFFCNLIGKMTVEMVIWRCWQESEEMCSTANEKEEKERKEK